MEGLVLFIHIVVCVLLVIIVLLQSGKSADLAGAFGGMGSQSTFGPRGTATLLSKMTTTLAVLFMITSLTLWIMAANRASTKSDSLVRPGEAPKKQTQTQTPTAAEDQADKAKAGQKEGAGKTQTPPAAEKEKSTGQDQNKDKGK